MNEFREKIRDFGHRLFVVIVTEEAVEHGCGKAEKIGVWEYGRERSNSQIKGNNRL